MRGTRSATQPEGATAGLRGSGPARCSVLRKGRELMPTTGTRRAGPRTARTGSRSRDSRSPSRRSTNRVTTARPRSPTLSSSSQRSELRQRLCSTLPVVGWRLPTLDSIETRKPSPGHGHTARGNACNRIRVWRVISAQIEHRPFSHISSNWPGQTLASHEVVVNLIAATTTRTGLTVHAEHDHADYQKNQDQRQADS